MGGGGGVKFQLSRGFFSRKLNKKDLNFFSTSKKDLEIYFSSSTHQNDPFPP